METIKQKDFKNEKLKKEKSILYVKIVTGFTNVLTEKYILFRFDSRK